MPLTTIDFLPAALAECGNAFKEFLARQNNATCPFETKWAGGIVLCLANEVTEL